jgi:hypothetical protein
MRARSLCRGWRGEVVKATVPGSRLPLPPQKRWGPQLAAATPETHSANRAGARLRCPYLARVADPANRRVKGTQPAPASRSLPLMAEPHRRPRTSPLIVPSAAFGAEC